MCHKCIGSPVQRAYSLHRSVTMKKQSRGFEVALGEWENCSAGVFLLFFFFFCLLLKDSPVTFASEPTSWALGHRSQGANVPGLK